MNIEDIDYYEILGITKNATPFEIKKAYKKLSMVTHPDKAINNEKANENFAKISNAYNILSDPNKRNIYDTYGTEGLETFGSDSNCFPGIFTNDRECDVQKPNKLKIVISLKDAYNGKNDVTINYKKKIICDKCDGTRNAEKKSICAECEGTGKLREMINMGGLVVNMSEITCTACDGTNKIKQYTECYQCNAQGVIIADVALTFDIPKGIKNNETIELENQGDKVILLIVSEDDDVRDHNDNTCLRANFRRFNENDLYTELELTQTELLCGFNKTFIHLDDHKFTIQNYDYVFNHDDVIRIEGQGMTSNHDLYVKLLSKKEKLFLDEENRAIVYKILTGKDHSVAEIPNDSIKVNFMEDNYFNKKRDEEEMEYDERSNFTNNQCVHQ